ncbi:MAG: hypothetical protein HQL47_03490 [Gammaproteobacteria bacterium]|nr:hypothetical protein [Gammaproteobacteria bacterium]
MLFKLSQWSFVCGLLLLGAALFFKDQLPDPNFFDDSVLQEPRQENTEREPFEVRVGEQNYRIIPQFDYALDGVVVSFNHADDWDNIYHRNWQDFINIKDVCVIWGANLQSGVYQRMSFKNTSWTCWFNWPDRATAAQFSADQLSNNHLLSDNPALLRLIRQAETGDQIRFKGVLAKYENPANGFQRGTSISRTDTGNGACETVYLDEFEIVRKANSGWRAAFSLSIWVTLISAVVWTGLVMSGRGSHKN